MTDSTKTWAWRIAVTAAIVTVIVASFYAEENARGVAVWKKCERELAARGESLEWTNFIPAPVPDGDNFYKAPMMSEWFVRGANNPASWSLNALYNPETQYDNITEISASNYIAWSTAFETNLDQIREALKRPDARMDGDYSRPFRQPIQNFVSYRNVSQVLAHRAKCFLLLNAPDKALEDLTMLHNLNQTLVKSGHLETLVTAMIHVAISGLYADAVACGIESRSWREPELAALQKQLSEINLLPDVAGSFRHERAAVCRLLDAYSLDELFRDGRRNTNFIPSDLGWWFVPSGVIYQNKALIVSLETEMLDCMDTKSNTVSPAKLKRYSLRVEDALRRSTPYNFIAVMCVPNFTKANETVARNQTMADQAQICCALERYRLVNGNYPAALAALVPKFIGKIPNDIIKGKPMSYQCTDGQNFKLWSVGWNEVDDGGITDFTSDGKEDRDFGDWVWRYPMF